VYFLDRPSRAPLRPIAVSIRIEVRFKDWFQQQLGGCLHHSIPIRDSRSLIIFAGNAEHVIMRLQTMVADAPLALDQQADQRQDQRHQLNQSATVSVVGTASEILHGEIRNISNGGTQIRLDQPLRYASLVTIDYDDNRLLGEVVYCEKEQTAWLVGIRVEHALLGLTILASIGERY
jgi:PilZ domain